MTAQDSIATNLSHHFLIAMPGMDDPSFARTVVYICEHTERGALGLCLNKPLPMTMLDLMVQKGLPLKRQDLHDLPLCWGGPVQTERGFVLHSKRTSHDDGHIRVAAASLEPSEMENALSDDDGGWPYASSLRTADGLQMTTSKDILEAFSAGGGPQQVFAALGYCAWERRQLEGELRQNAWLTVPATHGLIFDVALDLRYESAMQLLGFSEANLSMQPGHA